VKIAVIGAGSTYSPELLLGLAERALRIGLGSVSLYDIDRARLEVVGGFVDRMCARVEPRLAIERTSALERAIEGADFVVVQIRVGGQAARLEDERLGVKHGVIGQETTGVGGLSKALRTIPAILEIARVVESHAPRATLINFTNPVSIITEALLVHSATKAIGLCNIPISQRMDIAEAMGVRPDEVVIDSVGLNHLSFIRGVKIRGREVLGEVIARWSQRETFELPRDLVERLGMIPSDYLRYYYYQRETIAEQRDRKMLRAEEVMAVESELLEYYAKSRNTERPAALKKRGGAHYSHAALEIIESVALDRNDRLIVNTRNGDTLRELPRECSIEVPAFVGDRGAVPITQRPLEPQIRGLIAHVKSYEQLAITAALTRSPRDVYLALLAHPLTPSANTATAIVRDMRIG
jgi:6-phospho-beta-glucosidase